MVGGGGWTPGRRKEYVAARPKRRTMERRIAMRIPITVH
jgi:hypothetical protein